MKLTRRRRILWFSLALLSLAGVAVSVMTLSYLLYWVVDRITPFRVSRADELLGLDLSQHDEMGLSLEEMLGKKVPLLSEAAH